MAFLLTGGVGLLVKSLAGLSSTQASTRCSSLSRAVSVLQCTTMRWFSKKHTSEEFPRPPPPNKPPKRPLSSFFRFSTERRPVVAQQHPGSSTLELSKLIGIEWRGLPESEKQVYIDDARADYLNYRGILKKYKESLDPIDLEFIKERRKQDRQKKKTKRWKRELSLLGKPKRNRSSYNIYMAEHFHEAKGDSQGEKLIYVRRKWNSLPDSEKQVYIHLAEDDKVRYKNELQAWEEQMIEIGREDVLGKKKVRLLKKKSAAKTTSPDKSSEESHRSRRKPEE